MADHVEPRQNQTTASLTVTTTTTTATTTPTTTTTVETTDDSSVIRRWTSLNNLDPLLEEKSTLMNIHDDGSVDVPEGRLPRFTADKTGPCVCDLKH